MTTHADRTLAFRPFVYGSLPPCPGAYALFDLHDDLLYIGEAKNLKDTVQAHFTEGEDNPLLRGQVRGVVLYPTRTDTQAKEQEGRLFDQYLRATGHYPPANRSRPPEAAIRDDEIVRVRLRKAFGCDASETAFSDRHTRQPPPHLAPGREALSRPGAGSWTRPGGR